MFEIRSRRELLSHLPVTDQSHINSVSDVLHRFSKYRIIHQLKEIFLKAVLRSLPELRVLLNVTFQPRLLINRIPRRILFNFIPNERYYFKSR